MSIDFLNPDYTAVFKQRLDRLNKIRKDPSILPELIAYYREHPADFINDWGTTSDPRLVGKGLPSVVPFLLFDKQREMIDYIVRKWKKGEPGLIEKSRDVGASWVSMALACTLCLFNQGLVIGFGSRKEEYVDLKGSPKSLFWKGREFIKRLPREFRGSWTEADAPFLRIGFPATESYISGEAGDGIGRGDRAQPLDAKILTPTGWKLMGDIVIGDRVIGANGRYTTVTGVFPQGVKEVFRVTFSDNSSTECCDDHLWHVTTRAMRKVVKRAPIEKRKTTETCTVKQLRDIRYDLTASRNDDQTEYKYQIPILSAPVEFDCDALPLDPYILGSLLGDGSISQIHRSCVGFTTADIESVWLIQSRLPEHCAIKSNGSLYGYSIIDVRGGRGAGVFNPVKEVLFDLNLAGHKALTKFIPDRYKFASPYDRLELLRGLMDTDGWCASRKGGTNSYSAIVSISKQLIRDTLFIVQSLGGTGKITKIKAGRRMFPQGREYDCKSAEQLTISMPEGCNPFHLSRKAVNWKPRSTYKPYRSIVSAESVGFKETQCIRVDAADHLYVTDDCIVTHNTSLYLIDEAAHLERPELIDYSLSATTDCRIDMSSVKGMNNPFAEKRHGGRIEVFTFHWSSDPRRDQAWYEKKKLELPPTVVAQELDLDYSASVEGIIIPGEWARACVDAHTRLGIVPSGARSASLDVADAGIDNNAVCGAHGILIETLEMWSGKGSDIFATTEKAFAICDAKGYDTLTYDADGLGAGVKGDARVINEKRAVKLTVRPFRGSSSVENPKSEDIKGTKNEDYFYNHKAQAWWALRLRIERTFRWVVEGKPCDPDEILSISSRCTHYRQLLVELSQPTYKSNGIGKILVDKAPDGSKSPNLADAVVIKFGKAAHKPMIISGAALARFKGRR